MFGFISTVKNICLYFIMETMDSESQKAEKSQLQLNRPFMQVAKQIQATVWSRQLSSFLSLMWAEL
jgi:hypothetical protein